MTLQEIHDWVFTDLGFCGCGDPEAALEFLRVILNALDRGTNEERKALLKEKFAGNEGLYWTYLYLLDDNGLTEHGSNVVGCWLTEKGKDILLTLNSFSAEDVIENSQKEESLEDILDAEVIE